MGIHRGLFGQGIVPEWPFALWQDIRTTQAHVLERLITETRQLPALLGQLIPALELKPYLAGQSPKIYTMVWQHVYDCITFLTFHLVALLWGWRQSRAGLMINPTNVSYALHLGD